MKIVVFFEGDPCLRREFRDFFGGYFRDTKFLKLIACGSRPIKDFFIGKETSPNALKLLLMDADILGDGDYRMILREKQEWKQHCDEEVEDNQLHFMVKCMESWFLADKSALEKFYGVEEIKISKLLMFRRWSQVLSFLCK